MEKDPEIIRQTDENPVMILNSIARLFRAKAALSSDFSELLPHSSRRLLMHLGREDGRSQLELAELAHLSPPTVSLGLKKMEELGLIRREADEKDARISKVYLTDKGKELDKDNIARLRVIDDMVMRGLTEEELSFVKEILIKMRNNLLEEDTEK